MLKPCVGYKHMIASTKVQQLFTILIAFSNAMRTMTEFQEEQSEPT